MHPELALSVIDPIIFTIPIHEHLFDKGAPRQYLINQEALDISQAFFRKNQGGDILCPPLLTPCQDEHIFCSTLGICIYKFGVNGPLSMTHFSFFFFFKPGTVNKGGGTKKKSNLVWGAQPQLFFLKRGLMSVRWRSLCWTKRIPCWGWASFTTSQK